jgi:hypothetical protein
MVKDIVVRISGVKGLGRMRDSGKCWYEVLMALRSGCCHLIAEGQSEMLVPLCMH